MASEAQKRASKKWTDANRSKLTVYVTNDLNAMIRQRAHETTGSVNSYILELIKKDLGL